MVLGKKCIKKCIKLHVHVTQSTFSSLLSLSYFFLYFISYFFIWQTLVTPLSEYLLGWKEIQNSILYCVVALEVP